mmetsp:Transcript_23430/g.51434  ORF Transcript_23430/g.51434 Transcript_23430/m.51434 type:complete len:298 (-) Transcript_23430:1351-2244(-)
MACITNEISDSKSSAACCSSLSSNTRMSGTSACAVLPEPLSFFLPSFSLTTGYLAASCCSNNTSSCASSSSARSLTESLLCSAADRAGGARCSVAAGRGRCLWRALDFLRSSSCLRASSSLCLRAFASAASSSCSCCPSASSSGSSGISIWYSFWGAGREPRPARSSLRIAACLCCSARLLPATIRASMSFSPSSSRMGVAMGVAPGLMLPSRPGVAPSKEGVAATPAIDPDPRRCTVMEGVAPVVAPRYGVAAASRGLGVAATAPRGVTPLKSEGCSSGLSPPRRGVSMAFNRARF